MTAADIDKAKERLIASRVTHLDALADKLQEDRVRRVIEPVLAGLEVDSRSLRVILGGAPRRPEPAK